LFEVLSVEQVAGVVEPAPGLPPPAPRVAALDAMTQLRVLRRISDCLRSAEDVEALLESVLLILDEVLGFEHSMILLADNSGERLDTLASHGYPESGVGAVVRVGDGIIGTVAQRRRLMRVSSMTRALIYGRALRSTAESALADEIPLPGLPDAESQLAIPLVVQGTLIGVLAVESRRPLDYGEADEAFLEVVGGQIALALHDLLQHTETADRSGPLHRFLFYPADDCVFVDGEYLIRNVPGRILWKLLTAYTKEGRSDFTNRELRLDPALGLPSVRDNLESRLILLRMRLREKCPDVALVRTRRGQFTLEVRGTIELSEKR
jgi:hypothetical protein